MKLGYWSIKGLGQPIRLLLAYAGYEWEDVLYHCVEKGDGTYDKSSWFSVKYTLGLPFPNLPYLIDGDLKLTQTNAILQHIADRAGMSGDTAEEKARVAMLFGFSGDVRKRYTTAAYSKDFHLLKPELVEYLKAKLAELEAFAKEHGCSSSLGLVSEKITYVDLLWYDLVDQFVQMEPTILDGLDWLPKLHEKIHETKEIKDYRTSARFMSQLNNTQATFK